MIGSTGFRIIVENDFKPYMDMINDIAVGCDVTVMVKKSFRKPAVIGAPPTDHSSHLIGHAFDAVFIGRSHFCTTNLRIL